MINKSDVRPPSEVEKEILFGHYLPYQEGGYSMEMSYYLLLMSTDGGEEVYQKFVKIWSGFNEEATRALLTLATSDVLPIEVPELARPTEAMVPFFIYSPRFKALVLPWFDGVTRDGERTSRLMGIMLRNFYEYAYSFNSARAKILDILKNSEIDRRDILLAGLR